MTQIKQHFLKKIMKDKLNEITQIITSTTLPEIGLLTGLGGQILTSSELFLQNKISQEWLTHLHNVLEQVSLIFCRERPIKIPF